MMSSATLLTELNAHFGVALLLVIHLSQLWMRDVGKQLKMGWKE
jgi:hypothetical protein